MLGFHKHHRLVPSTESFLRLDQEIILEKQIVEISKNNDVISNLLDSGTSIRTHVGFDLDDGRGFLKDEILFVVSRGEDDVFVCEISPTSSTDYAISQAVLHPHYTANDVVRIVDQVFSALVYLDLTSH